MRGIQLVDLQGLLLPALIISGSASASVAMGRAGLGNKMPGECYSEHSTPGHLIQARQGGDEQVMETKAVSFLKEVMLWVSNCRCKFSSGH